MIRGASLSLQLHGGEAHTRSPRRTEGATVSMRTVFLGGVGAGRCSWGRSDAQVLPWRSMQARNPMVSCERPAPERLRLLEHHTLEISIRELGGFLPLTALGVTAGGVTIQQRSQRGITPRVALSCSWSYFTALSRTLSSTSS